MQQRRHIWANLYRAAAILRQGNRRALNRRGPTADRGLWDPPAEHCPRPLRGFKSAAQTDANPILGPSALLKNAKPPLQAPLASALNLPKPSFLPSNVTGRGGRAENGRRSDRQIAADPPSGRSGLTADDHDRGGVTQPRQAPRTPREPPGKEATEGPKREWEESRATLAVAQGAGYCSWLLGNAEGPVGTEAAMRLVLLTPVISRPG
ncbi:hypothetical protein SKAU_G00130210 [Synaphobranchus kaupii]|uniref:Uncharacterized protein n=1 Tax=Synaphobranchus kaupii TaxID=118154 RepID=A0A9Q1J3D4_SYNKA|nr:hypothetical protein SKAU_G00130210 [Synaphobranchus kaupii]